jgi:hypothetical protein
MRFLYVFQVFSVAVAKIYCIFGSRDPAGQKNPHLMGANSKMHESLPLSVSHPCIDKCRQQEPLSSCNPAWRCGMIGSEDRGLTAIAWVFTNPVMNVLVCSMYAIRACPTRQYLPRGARRIVRLKVNPAKDRVNAKPNIGVCQPGLPARGLSVKQFEEKIQAAVSVTYARLQVWYDLEC